LLVEVSSRMGLFSDSGWKSWPDKVFCYWKMFN
jgi:hypothetical protein